MLIIIDGDIHLESDAAVAILAYGSNPTRRLKAQAAESGHLLDATRGRRTRSVIITETNHVILSRLTTETLSQRYANAIRNAPAVPSLSLLTKEQRGK